MLEEFYMYYLWNSIFLEFVKLAKNDDFHYAISHELFHWLFFNNYAFFFLKIHFFFFGINTNFGDLKVLKVINNKIINL